MSLSASKKRSRKVTAFATALVVGLLVGPTAVLAAGPHGDSGLPVEGLGPSNLRGHAPYLLRGLLRRNAALDNRLLHVGIEPYSQHPSGEMPYAVCPPPKDTGAEATCASAVVPAKHGRPAIGPGKLGPQLEGSGVGGGFSPADLRSAYNLPAEGGEGQTVAITIAYDNPKAESDLAAYREYYGLPPCTTANGCFKKVNQYGETENYPVSDPGWAAETALDLDMVSSTCPKCHILLVEARSNEFEDLGMAVETAAELGAVAISNSWASPVEFLGETSFDHYFDHPGIPVLFASGDWGYNIGYPTASPDVIGVGGTRLQKAENVRGWSEAAWDGAGSGCSVYEEKPAWQTDEGCDNHAVADVAAVADPETPVSVYDTFKTGGKWFLFGGTSVAAPLIAGIEAQASKYVRSLPGGDVFYSDQSALFDVTSGTNRWDGGPCKVPAEDPAPSEYLCHGGVGYDGPTGNGSPNGIPELTELPPLAVTRSATGVTGATAKLAGVVGPQGLETTYHFEYDTAEYKEGEEPHGTSVPVPGEGVGTGTNAVKVSKGIEGFLAGTTYHYRLVASNSAGVSYGKDRSFRTASPTVTGVSPDSGQAAGGASVSISGTNFVGVTAVKFGANEAESFKVESASTISAIAPAVGEIGVVDVTVTTPAGTSPTGSADRFAYELGPSLAWGANLAGALGNRQSGYSNTPVEVSGLPEPLSLAAGGLHSLALMPDGTVMAWGENGSWELGTGKRLTSHVPIEVCAEGVTECPNGPYLEEVTSISAGASHSLALLQDGTVLAWGNNYEGQLGTGNLTNCGAWNFVCSKVPAHVCAVAETTCKPENYLKDVVAIAAGGYHSLALLSNGTVVSWGYNEQGELGNGTSTGPETCGEVESYFCSTVPVPVSGLAGVSAIAAGNWASYALLKDGTAMAWGENEFGQLGDGTIISRSSPVPVCADGEEVAQCTNHLGDVKAISGGGNAGYALLKDGTVRAWGSSPEGELGNGSYTGKSCGGYCSAAPVKVKGLSDVTAIAAGVFSSHAMAIDDGELMAWGGGKYGELGSGESGFGFGGGGSSTESNVPVPVCAAYTSGPCPSGPYLSEQGGSLTMAVGGFHTLVSISRVPVAITKAATGLKTTSATLNAMVNPSGLETTYHFEYDTAEYREGEEPHGTSVPVPGESAGSDTANVEVDEEIEGLEVGETYHFRIVATNDSGTSYGDDEAFTTERGGSEENSMTFDFAFGKAGEEDGKFGDPYYLAIDPAGNLWVSDWGINRVQKFDSKGKYLSKFGSFGSSDGEFSYPKGIAIDSAGNILVVDGDNGRIEKFDSKGEYLSKFGGGIGSKNGQFMNPYGLAIDSAGNVWVADTWNNRIQKFNSKGEYLSKFGTEGSGNGELGSPWDLAIDSAGNVWVADTWNNRIQKFNSKGEYLSKFGTKGTGNGELNEPGGIAIDSAGDIWVADTNNHRIQKFNSKGEYLSQFGKEGSGKGELLDPHGLAVDSTGAIWVVDTNNNRIQKWVPSTPPTATTEAATEVKGSSATLTGTVNPEGLATKYFFEYGETEAYGSKVAAKSAGSGTSNVAESERVSGLDAGTTYHFRIVAKSAAGTAKGEDKTFKTKTVISPWVAKLGSGGAGDGQLDQPYGVAVDPDGNFWVADDANRRVQKLNPEGEFLLMVGKEVNKTRSEEKGSFKAARNLCTAASGDKCGPGTGSEVPGIAIGPEGDVWVSESTSSHIAHYTIEGEEYLGQVGTPGKGEGQISSPRGIAFDQEGNLLVADQGNSRIVKFNSEGKFLAEFGANGEANGELKDASGVTVDAKGNIWVADTGNNRVQKFDSEGKFLAKYGSEGTGNGKFQAPFAIAAGAHGTIWVADGSNHRIQALNGQGEYLTQLGKYGTGNGELFYPRGIGFDSEGDLWVADRDNDRIQKWNLIYLEAPRVTIEGASAVKATSAHLYGKVNPEGNATYHFEYDTAPYKVGEASHGTSVPVPSAALGPADEYIPVSYDLKGLTPVTTYHYRLLAESAEGTAYGEEKTFTTTADDRFVYSFGEAGSGNGQLGKGATGIATDSSGDFFVVDTANNRVQKFAHSYPDPPYLYQFGTYGTGNGQLKSPNSIAIDSSGNLWVTDTGNNRVQKFNSKGEYVSQFGKEGVGNGEFKSPKGIALDSTGKIFVVDSGNNRVQKFNSKGEYVSQFGKEGTGNGEFKAPTGIAVDSSNFIFVVDSGNNRVQKFNSSLAYQAQFGSKEGKAASGNGEFNAPTGIAVDPAGKLWVTDTGNDRAQRFSSSGAYLEKFGETGSGSGQLDGPTGIITPATSWTWKLTFVDAANNRVQQWEMAPDPPVATTEAASEVKSTSATLNATINPNGLYTTYHFEYGKTTSYGTSVPVPDEYVGSTITSIKVSKAITGLASGTKYNFRVVATNASGTTKGVNKTFTTP
jgi:DNA-binding beta-propeller fold protein YncE/alpha-tubulin suppressor-like RCC1 family protein